jgi:hypothetical protein
MQYYKPISDYPNIFEEKEVLKIKYKLFGS